jgi:fatty acid-binding protein DegV
MIKMLYKRFFNEINEGKRLRIAVLHGDALDEAEKLADKICKEFDPIELIINITGPVLGINTGPGALALCGYCETS